MRKVALFVTIASLCLIGTMAYAAPYAAHLDSSASAFSSGGNVDLEFTLNEDAKAVTVEIIGPLPATTVLRTFNLGALSRGDQSVNWDGQVFWGTAWHDVASGNYKFTVKAESDGYGSSWTNITPLGAYDAWTTPTTELGIANTPNIRGIGFNGTNLIISATSPVDALYVVNSSGEYQHNLGLTVVDTYDADNDADYAETWSLAGWLGPYDVATATDGSVYLGAFLGAGFPISRIESDLPSSNPVAVCFQDAHSRAIDVVNAGASTIIYQVSGYTAGGNPVRVFDSTDGTTFSLLETTGAMPNSHMIIGRDGNTGGDDDVLWVSSNGGYVERWVRSGGTWANDTAFSGPENTCGGDYLQIGGKDVIAVIINSSNDIVLADGDTGAELARWAAPTRATWGGNGDLVVSGSAIYFVLPDCNVFGKLDHGEIGSAQYYAPTGIDIFSDPSSEHFGHLLVAHSYTAPSTNPGAEANKNGVYVLDCDMTYTGDSEAASWAAAMNDPASPWDGSDSFSPWKMHFGPDESILTVGDWGTGGVTDAVCRYDLETTATNLLPAGAGDHGRVHAAMTYGTDAARKLVGIDRDVSHKVMGWDVGTSTTYYGPTYIIVDAPSTGLGFSAWSHRDIDIGTSGSLDVLYVCNRRWGAGDVRAYALDLATTTLLWSKTGTQLGGEGYPYVDGVYFSGVAVDQTRGVVYYLDDFRRQVASLDMTDGSLVESFGPFSSSGGRAIAVDPAGNVYTSNHVDEHVRMWAPPGASDYTTTYWSLISFTNLTRLEDWREY